MNFIMIMVITNVFTLMYNKFWLVITATGVI